MRRRGVAAVAAGLLLSLPTAALAQDAQPDHSAQPAQDGEATPDGGSARTTQPAADAGTTGATDQGGPQTGVGVADSVERGPAQGLSSAQAPSEQATASTSTEQAPADRTGIGQAEAVECRGAVAASVVDLDGASVGGALLSVAGQQVAGAGTVEALCGEVGAALLAVPNGYAPAGPTSMNVQVRRGDTTVITFVVDPVQVLGTQFERPAQPPAAPAPPSETAAAAPPVTDASRPASELAATGPEDAPGLLLLALLCGLAGTVLLAATPPSARRGPAHA